MQENYKEIEQKREEDPKRWSKEGVPRSETWRRRAVVEGGKVALRHHLTCPQRVRELKVK